MLFPYQLWALAVPAVITECDGGFHEALGGWGDNENTRPWCKARLSKYYGVNSPAELQACAQQLFSEGSSKEARERLASLPPDPGGDDPQQALVRAHREGIERAGLIAWDLARLIAVVGWGAWAGYVPELDAWQVVMVSAARVQQAYGSWKELAEAYELGRLYWSKGEEHAPTARAMEKLLTDPASPWQTLPWGSDLKVSLGGAAKSTVRFKRSVCPRCGAPKQRPSATGYVYCDYCGSLSDYDFAKACEQPLARPGPVYEALAAEMKPALDAAHARGDQDAYRAAQIQLFEGYVAACPDAVPPRVRDPAYRAKFVAYLAEAAVVTAFDEGARVYDARLAEATKALSFTEVAPGKLQVSPGAFDVFLEAVFAQQDYLAALHEAKGVYAMQPDGASKELQRRLGISMFVQGWLPMLDELRASQLLLRTHLKSDYVQADLPRGEGSTCGACGGGLSILAGARSMVCDGCGRKLDAGERVPCTGCGASLTPDEGVTRFACPHCHVAVQRMQTMKPG